MSKHWNDEESFHKGMETLKVLGRENRMMDQKALSEDLYRLTVGHLWGDIWTRPHLSLEERQLITLAINIATARPSGNVPHFNSARKIGISHEKIMELIIHVGAYCGWPTMAHAVAQYHEALKEAGAAPPGSRDADTPAARPRPE